MLVHTLPQLELCLSFDCDLIDMPSTCAYGVLLPVHGVRTGKESNTLGLIIQQPIFDHLVM